jgi:hypothetical protein
MAIKPPLAERVGVYEGLAEFAPPRTIADGFVFWTMAPTRLRLASGGLEASDLPSSAGAILRDGNWRLWRMMDVRAGSRWSSGGCGKTSLNLVF